MAIKSDRAYRKEYHAILAECTVFGLSDTEDVPLSAIVHAGLVSLLHRAETAEAEGAGLRARLQAIVTEMERCYNEPASMFTYELAALLQRERMSERTDPTTTTTTTTTNKGHAR